jgi:hypothetical protein
MMRLWKKASAVAVTKPSQKGMPLAAECSHAPPCHHPLVHNYYLENNYCSLITIPHPSHQSRQIKTGPGNVHSPPATQAYPEFYLPFQLCIRDRNCPHP